MTKFANNADNTQLTLTLKDGVTFTDGSTLDSTLVKANLDRRSDPSLPIYQQFAKGGGAEITDVAAPDPKTVVITWADAAGHRPAVPGRHRGRHRRQAGRRDPRRRWPPLRTAPARTR